MILWKPLLINMPVDNLIDIVVGAKAVPQGIILLLTNPSKMVKTKKRELLHAKPQLTPLRKVSI